ncbi:MAG: PHP domain-containing protein [Chloroflexi bacterium]|nr:PHP domain-containing protein [Chloroflexota bacterium]
MRTFIAELHVHTVLSPCAEIEMIPPLIVQEALDHGINLIAITDHNASANVRAVQTAARGTELAVLAGMELQTREEVHLLCLFDTAQQVEDWQATVDLFMPGIENNANLFGEQFVVDESGEYIQTEKRLLITSADLSLHEAVEGVRALGGMAIPAHVNRKAFSLIANLGLVPTDVPFDALEISRHLSIDEAVRQYPQLKGYPLIQSGDVHRLDEFLGKNVFKVEAPTVSELRLALMNEDGRKLSFRSTRTV